MSDPLATFQQQLKIRHCIFVCLQQVSLGLPARCRAESSFFGARQKSQRQQKLKTRNGSTLNASFRSRAAALPFSKVLLKAVLGKTISTLLSKGERMAKHTRPKKSVFGRVEIQPSQVQAH